MKIKIAVVQFESIRLSPEKNLKKAEEYIARAAKNKANIVVFPEDFITGTVGILKQFVDYTEKYRKHFQILARKYHIDIMPGSIIEGDKKGWHNIAYYIDSKGKVLSRYRKINLWHAERPYVNFGKDVHVFNTKYGKMGLLVCWDIMFPEVFRKMARQGVEIVICPSCWSREDAGLGLKYDKQAGTKLIDSLCIGRAFENEIIFIYCNSAGRIKEGNEINTRFGHSQVTAPFKGVIKKADSEKEQMFFAEVDTSILKDAEKIYKVRKDLKNRIL